MINIVVSRSQQPGNKCVVGDCEQDHMGIIANKLALLLINDGRFNVFNIPELDLGTNENLYEIVRISDEFIDNNGGDGYHIALHSDGGYEGHGASAFYFSDSGLCFIKPVYEAMCKLTPWNDMNLRAWSGLYELRNTKAIAGLIEVSFHDKLKEAQWIHNNFDAIAKTIYNGIVRGVDLMPAPAPAQNISFDDALKICKDNGIISDITFWKNSLEYIKYIDDLLINVATKIKPGG